MSDIRDDKVQLAKFNFSGIEDQGFQDCNEFLADENCIDIQCTNNGYGSHIYIMYKPKK